MDAEIEATEVDQRYEQRRAHDQHHAAAPGAHAGPGQIRERAVYRCRRHRVAARERVGVELDEGDFRPRSMERQLQDDVQQLRAGEHDGQERSLDETPTAVEDEADNGADCERERRAAEEGEHAEGVHTGGRSLAREPPGEADVPTRERVVRQVVLRDPGERECRESGRRQRKSEAPLLRGMPYRRDDRSRPTPGTRGAAAFHSSCVSCLVHRYSRYLGRVSKTGGRGKGKYE